MRFMKKPKAPAMKLKKKINVFLWFGGSSKDRGENFAVKFLKKNGYKILCQNFNAGFAEIDIITEKAGVVSFVEVKQRRGTAFGLPREAVGHEKQRKIRRAAEYYILKNHLQKTFRFDVIEVYGSCDGTEKPKIIHIKNAF